MLLDGWLCQKKTVLEKNEKISKKSSGMRRETLNKFEQSTRRSANNRLEIVENGKKEKFKDWKLASHNFVLLFI